MGPVRKPDEPITERHQNIAASAQKVVEEVVLYLLEVFTNRQKKRIYVWPVVWRSTPL
ncbi:MAG: hypothetical protein IPL01_22500 [Acidobacteria bacterium]|nr:hypothetical protein [Acidobacteriota bacterium]